MSCTQTPRECCPQSIKPQPKKRSRIKLPPDQYKALCRLVHTRDKWKCRVRGCGNRSGLHSHHIVFRSHGGDDASYNLITVCNFCHDKIHARQIILLPLRDGEPIDADKGVRWWVFTQ